MEEHVAVWPHVWLMAAVVTATMLSISSARADRTDEDAQIIRRGYEIIDEIFPRGKKDLNLAGKDRELVGLGSYYVNTNGCNDCHTYPNWAAGHNPFNGEPQQVNTDRYLAGGRPFGSDSYGPIVSANLTPDLSEKPAGLNWWEFRNVMRTGHDPHVDGRLLQVMPWPIYRWKTDPELRAMYEYLRAIPSCQDTPSPEPACKINKIK
jgi:hypothetical protein